MTEEVKNPPADAAKETNLVEGLSALSSEKFMEDFLMEKPAEEKPKEPIKVDEPEKKSPVAEAGKPAETQPDKDKAVSDKKIADDKAIADLERIRTEDYKGKTPE